MSNLLGSVVNNYKFSLPELQLRRGAVYTGANSRLRRVVRDLLTGRRPVRVGVVGGSISWGQGASDRGVTDWFSVVTSYLSQAFPNTNVTSRNGCLPGTPSEFTVKCLELSVERNVDLVFIEYNINDGFHNGVLDNPRVKVHERLIRRLLSLPGRPALVYMQVRCNMHALPFSRSTGRVPGGGGAPPLDQAPGLLLLLLRMVMVHPRWCYCSYC